MISQDNTQTHTSSEGGTVAGPSTGAGDRWIGKALSDYQVLNRLDAGAMGTVYRARHQHTGAMAAVKTVPTVREGLLPRIRREIHALAHVRHPGIVRILDSGTLDGVPWYAMELVEGMTLREYVPATAQTGKPEELTERLELVHQLCGALAYLHGEGLIHRDLKPSNVMVRPGHQPVLVDFGLVSEVPGAAGREALDAELGTVGTPLYMAPEQIQGELLDARTDLYALGCILYELLC